MAALLLDAGVPLSTTVLAWTGRYENSVRDYPGLVVLVEA